MKAKKIVTIVFVLASMLQACTTEHSGLNSSTGKGAAMGAATGAVVGGVSNVGIPVGAGVGAVIGGTYGYFFSKNPDALQILGSYGVSVMRLGDGVVITIPSVALFEGYSVEISRSGYTILEQIAVILEPMNKIEMTTAAYASSAVQTEKDLILTQHQAQTVSNYLWDHGVDARLFYAVGYGGGHPVQYAPYKAIDDIVGDYSNYRVEITLKDYVL